MSVSYAQDNIPSSLTSTLQAKLIFETQKKIWTMKKNYHDRDRAFLNLYNSICDSRKNGQGNATVLVELATDNFYLCRLKLKEMKFYLKAADKKCDFITKQLQLMEVL